VVLDRRPGWTDGLLPLEQPRGPGLAGMFKLASKGLKDSGGSVRFRGKVRGKERNPVLGCRRVRTGQRFNNPLGWGTTFGRWSAAGRAKAPIE
jgi:hypothetical protein